MAIDMMKGAFILLVPLCFIGFMIVIGSSARAVPKIVGSRVVQIPYTAFKNLELLAQGGGGKLFKAQYGNQNIVLKAVWSDLSDDTDRAQFAQIVKEWTAIRGVRLREQKLPDAKVRPCPNPTCRQKSKDEGDKPTRKILRQFGAIVQGGRALLHHDADTEDGMKLWLGGTQPKGIDKMWKKRRGWIMSYRFKYILRATSSGVECPPLGCQSRWYMVDCRNKKGCDKWNSFIRSIKVRPDVYPLAPASVMSPLGLVIEAPEGGNNDVEEGETIGLDELMIAKKKPEGIAHVYVAYPLCQADLNDYITNWDKNWQSWHQENKSYAFLTFFHHIFISFKSSLEFLKEARIHHRDIKPKNVMMCRQRNPSASSSASSAPLFKLIDFGEWERPVDPPVHFRGTDAFLSPALHNNKGDNYSDYWAAAISLLQILRRDASKNAPYYSCRGKKQGQFDDIRKAMKELGYRPNVDAMVDSCGVEQAKAYLDKGLGAPVDKYFSCVAQILKQLLTVAPEHERERALEVSWCETEYDAIMLPQAMK